MNWGACYYDHFVNYLRSPTDRQIFEQNSDDPTIQVLAFDHVFEDCRVFCSLGLTHYMSVVRGVGEVYAVVDGGWDDVPYLLANALFFMTQQSMQLGWGISIGGIQNILPSFAQKFDKQALYITTPFGLPDEFSNVFCNQQIGKVYLAVFISREEEKFFKDHGAKAFEHILAEKEVDPFNIRRSSCI